jgi:hypothetical protein
MLWDHQKIRGEQGYVFSTEKDSAEYIPIDSCIKEDVVFIFWDHTVLARENKRQQLNRGYPRFECFFNSKRGYY